MYNVRHLRSASFFAPACQDITKLHPGVLWRWAVSIIVCQMDMSVMRAILPVDHDSEKLFTSCLQFLLLPCYQQPGTWPFVEASLLSHVFDRAIRWARCRNACCRKQYLQCSSQGRNGMGRGTLIERVARWPYEHTQCTGRVFLIKYRGILNQKQMMPNDYSVSMSDCACWGPPFEAEQKLEIVLVMSLAQMLTVTFVSVMLHCGRPALSRRYDTLLSSWVVKTVLALKAFACANSS